MGRFERDRPRERLGGLGGALPLDEDEAEQVVGACQPVVLREGLPTGALGAIELVAVEQRQGQLEPDPRRPFVNHQRRLVPFARPLPALLRGVHVAELLFDARRGRVERPRMAQVAEGRRRITLLTVDLAPPEPGEHRIGLDRDRAAEGLDGRRRLRGGQREFTIGEELAVRALAPERQPTDHRQGRQPDQRDGDDQPPGTQELSGELRVLTPQAYSIEDVPRGYLRAFL